LYCKIKSYRLVMSSKCKSMQSFLMKSTNEITQVELVRLHDLKIIGEIDIEIGS